jgi:sterol desaturase/sphingolipid hydroxylase (fatty acid hydroxylase superfamily)
MLKSIHRFPATPWFPRGEIDLAAERHIARRRLVPLVVFYTSFSALVLTVAAVYSPHRWRSFACFLLGIALWTPLEYWVHRRVLHGKFPDGPGPWRHLLHKQFDHLHWEHHLKPWSGRTISGSLDQTLPVVLALAAISLLTAPYTMLVTVAGIAQSYVVEEWVHYSVHFEQYKSRYFRYIKKHHLFHHSPRGYEMGFGLTSGIWDVVFETRLPEEARLLLYKGRKPASDDGSPRPWKGGSESGSAAA